MLGTGLTRRAARGPRSSGSEAANTDRRARKATRGDPQVKVPAPGLFTGSYPKDARRHGQPAPILPAPPAPRGPVSQHARTRPRTAPQSGSDPRQPATRSPAPTSQGQRDRRGDQAYLMLNPHDHEYPRDHAAPGAQAPRASPRTALTLTTHHFNERHCPKSTPRQASSVSLRPRIRGRRGRGPRTATCRSSRRRRSRCGPGRRRSSTRRGPGGWRTRTRRCPRPGGRA